MDYQVLVQQKLSTGHHCLCCILGSLIENGERQSRVIALVEGQGEFGLFLYTHGQVSTKSAADLRIDTAFPITQDFKFNVRPPSETDRSNGAVPVQMNYSSFSFMLELPQAEEAGIFLAEVKRAISVQSQNSGFGLPSTFAWIEKYMPGSQSSDQNNPFLDDVFDPLKQASHNSDGWPWSEISQSSGNSCPVVKDTTMEKSPSLQGFQDNFLDSWSSQGSLTTINKAGSDKTDAATRSYEASLDDLGDSIRGGKPVQGRENLIKLIMKQKQDEYTDIIKYRVFCGTWNVNGQPASEEVQDWLACDDEPPDIYAIGFQELDLSKNAYIFSDSQREEDWYKRLKAGLHPKAKYKRIKLIRLVGMMLVVFVQTKHLGHIFDVDAAVVGTGIMGMLGNKGGVGVRFELHDTSICFVNSHLAAHTEEYERRNQDFRDINSRMSFVGKPSPTTISEHDLVFWIGDLNYRLSDVSNEECKKLIANKDFHTLMGFDQLCRQISMKRVFLDYIEGRITFVPTYKFDPGTDKWDTSEKCRTPAWCDRVLWRGSNIGQLVYRSHMSLKLSDHKPVSAVFDTGVRKVNKPKYRKVYEDVMKQLDRMENEFLPQVALDTMEVQFENVKFVEPQSKTLTVANTGQVPVQYEFINKLNESSYCKPWLSVKPNKSVIQVGETCEIQVEVYVEKTTAPKLNSGADRMEDILILHLEGGKDLFISVSGNYLPSSFGSSIEALVHMYGPIREVPVAQLIDLEHIGSKSNSSTVSKDRPLDIPKEIWRLIDHLYKYGVEQEELFQVPGQHQQIQLIRDSLDTGTPADLPGSVHSVAESLLLFMEAIAEPVIPYAFYTKCLDCCSNYTLCKQVLSQIPVGHRVLFMYICAFLRKLLRHTSQNNLEIKFLATLFGGLLLRAPPEDTKVGSPTGNRRSQVQSESRKKAAFIYHFLTNEYDEAQ